VPSLPYFGRPHKFSTTKEPYIAGSAEIHARNEENEHEWIPWNVSKPTNVNNSLIGEQFMFASLLTKRLARSWQCIQDSMPHFLHYQNVSKHTQL
jgi:hypothetical protein